MAEDKKKKADMEAYYKNVDKELAAADLEEADVARDMTKQEQESVDEVVKMLGDESE